MHARPQRRASTTLRILLGLVKAGGGSVYSRGCRPDAVDPHRHIAYVPGDVTLWPSLTGGETIDRWSNCRAEPIRSALARTQLSSAPTQAGTAKGLPDSAHRQCHLLLLDAEQRPGPVG